MMVRFLTLYFPVKEISYFNSSFIKKNMEFFSFHEKRIFLHEGIKVPSDIDFCRTSYRSWNIVILDLHILL